MTKLIKLWVCSDCDAEFGSKVMGIKHLKNHKVEGDKK